MNLEFFVPGQPAGKGRPRFARNGHVYTPKKTETYESTIRLFASQAMNGSAPTEMPVSVYIRAVFAMPASWSKKKRGNPPHHTSRPDGDNVQKAALDAMAGVVFLNDKQVFRMSVDKAYGDAPGLRIFVLSDK